MNQDPPLGVEVWRCPGGPTGLRRARDALAAGGVAGVVILTRFLDHSSSQALVALCRARCIAYRRARTVARLRPDDWVRLAKA